MDITDENRELYMRSNQLLRAAIFGFILMAGVQVVCATTPKDGGEAYSVSFSDIVEKENWDANATEDQEQALMLTQGQRRYLQKILNYLGQTVGEPDGQFGESTRNAIRRFKEGIFVLRGEKITGYLNIRIIREILSKGLINAAYHNDAGMVKEVLDVLGNNKFRYDEGGLALRMIADKGYLEVVEALLGAGVDINAMAGMRLQQSPLMSASDKGDIKIVNALIRAGARVNDKSDFGTTALMYAALKGHCKVVETLIGAGADVNLANKGGWTALMIASKNGRDEVVKTLLDAGANLDAINSKEGRTALIEASCQGHNVLVKTLLAHGADVDVKASDGTTAMSCAKDGGYESLLPILAEGKEAANERKRFFDAIERGDVDTVDRMLRAGMDVEAISKKLAFHNTSDDIKSRSVKAMLAEWKNVPALVGDGMTPLMVAAVNGHVDVVKHLLEAGANINAKDHDGVTALHLATYAGHSSVVEELLEAGADANITDKKGNTPLLLAVYIGNEDLFDTLLGAGSDVDVKDEKGNPLPLVALQGGHKEIAQKLLSIGIIDRIFGKDVHVADGVWVGRGRKSSYGKDGVKIQLYTKGGKIQSIDMELLYTSNKNCSLNARMAGHNAIIQDPSSMEFEQGVLVDRGSFSASKQWSPALIYTKVSMIDQKTLRVDGRFYNEQYLGGVLEYDAPCGSGIIPWGAVWRGGIIK